MPWGRALGLESKPRPQRGSMLCLPCCVAYFRMVHLLACTALCCLWKPLPEARCDPFLQGAALCPPGCGLWLCPAFPFRQKVLPPTGIRGHWLGRASLLWWPRAPSLSKVSVV